MSILIQIADNGWVLVNSESEEVNANFFVVAFLAPVAVSERRVWCDLSAL
jgi:hypothetical protein